MSGIGSPRPIQRLVIGSDGNPKLVYIDPNTGQQVQNPNGFVQNTDLDLNFLGDKDVKDRKTKDFISPKVTQKPKVVPGRGEVENPVDPREGAASGVNNNFGYIHKPGILGLAALAPGATGLLGKLANAAVNYNNVEAVDKAREYIGLPDQSTGSKIRGTFKDNQGQVADVNLNDRLYSVGMEAVDPRTGYTNLTPDEARKRGLTLGGVTEEPQDSALQTSRGYLHPDITPEEHGLFSSAKQHIHSFLDHVFGGSTDYSHSFPDAPANPAGYGQPTRGGIDRGAISPAASDAIDKGSGGLYQSERTISFVK